MHKLVFFVPLDGLQHVKDAIFAAGAGRQGEYSRCCFQTLGQGEFLPSANANPTLGEQGSLHKVSEMRVETLVAETELQLVIEALKKAHPYESPAYEIYKLLESG